MYAAVQVKKTLKYESDLSVFLNGSIDDVSRT